MSELFNTSMVLTADPPTGFRYQMAAVSDSSLMATALRFGGSSRTGAEEFPQFIVAHAVAGRHRWSVGQESGDGRIPFLVPPGTRFQARFSQLQLRAVTIDADTFHRVLRGMLGEEPPRLRTDRVNGTAERHVIVAETLRFIEATLLADETVATSPLLRAQFTHQLVAAIATSFPLLGEHARTRGQASPRTVRRAIAFMEDHVADPITIGDVALAAGTSVRGLQLAFRRSYEMSPSAFLRRIRLEGAHADLMTADAGARTVREIAAQWGFAHTGRFAHLYAAAYGEPPSHTLRR